MRKWQKIGGLDANVVNLCLPENCDENSHTGFLETMLDQVEVEVAKNGEKDRTELGLCQPLLARFGCINIIRTYSVHI